VRCEPCAAGREYTAGIVHFGAADVGLADCLASLRNQTCSPNRIIVVDQSGDPSARTSLGRDGDDVDWVVSENRGYAGGANRLIARSFECCPNADFVLVMNPDVSLEPEFAEALVREMEDRPDVALASGKLLRPDGRTIDSAGIAMGRTRRFYDRGSEDADDGRFDTIERVFAVSGAAMMIRCAVLPILAVDGEIFDEDFFIYHEDTDLAWRARNCGYSSLYVPGARATHVRGWKHGQAQRFQIASNIRRHSFKNRYLEMIKNERLFDFVRHLPFILASEVARFAFALLKDREVLGAYRDAAVCAPRAFRKRRAILRNARMAIKPRVGTDAVPNALGD
jgi:GT2 family glycosyltransferase